MRKIIENRIDKSGVAEPQVVAQGNDRIVVEMPGVQNADQIRSLIGTTGRLDFVPLGDTPDDAGPAVARPAKAVPAAVLGRPDRGRVRSARTRPASGRSTSRSATEGKDLFADYTADNIGKYFAIVLDGEVISAPVIQSSIPGGQVQISRAASAATRWPRSRTSSRSSSSASCRSRSRSSPTRGQPDARRRTSCSRACSPAPIAILMVFVFMVVHYRLPGVVACVALIFYALVVYALFRLIPVTLTLAGIAGFVLSVGMAVDANILIFERTKEELRVGQDPAGGDRGRLQPGLELDPRLERVEPHHRDDPVPVRLVDDPRLRPRADHRRARVDVHGDRRHPDDAPDRRPAAVGPEGVAVRRHRGGVPRAPDAGARTLRGEARTRV